MNKADIKYIDTINGYGLRVSLFVSGCTIKCTHCFNKKCQDFNYGTKFTDKDLEKIIDTINSDKINYSGLSILGGEPMDNYIELYPILKELKSRLKQDKTIWMWSGHTLEELSKNHDRIECLKYIDVLIDGPYKEELKDLSLKYRGSSNQRIIDMEKSMQYFNKDKNEFEKIILFK